MFRNHNDRAAISRRGLLDPSSREILVKECVDLRRHHGFIRYGWDRTEALPGGTVSLNGGNPHSPRSVGDGDSCSTSVCALMTSGDQLRHQGLSEMELARCSPPSDNERLRDQGESGTTYTHQVWSAKAGVRLALTRLTSIISCFLESGHALLPGQRRWKRGSMHLGWERTSPRGKCVSAYSPKKREGVDRAGL